MRLVVEWRGPRENGRQEYCLHYINENYSSFEEIEQCMDGEKDLHMVFIDLKEAYNKVSREFFYGDA